MVWKHGEYLDLKPIAQLRASIMKNLALFLNNPIGWDAEKINRKKQNVCLDRLKQEITTELLVFIQKSLIENKKDDWDHGVELYGTGSTGERARLIYEIMSDCAPEITIAHSQAFKDEIIKIIETSINRCSERARSQALDFRK